MDKVDYIKNNLRVDDVFNEVILPELEDYYDGVKRIDFEFERAIRCPFHVEQEGSFRLYLGTNSFCCYGCGVAGDVIELYRTYLDKIKDKYQTFEQVEDFLFNLAKDVGNGKTKVQMAKMKEQGKVLINTKQDLIRFNMDLNKLIYYTRDKKISIEDRLSILSSFALYRDNVLEQEMKVSDAIKELKNIVLNICQLGEMSGS